MEFHKERISWVPAGIYSILDTGNNTSSFVSGVGANSMTTAYGYNRADLSYIPGCVTSVTALIRSDFPELPIWPFLLQQGDYMLGRGTTDYLFPV